jgi:Polysaccharide deacetylase
VLAVGAGPPPLSFEGTLVLRMDDPGGAENVHHAAYARSKLDRATWAEVGDVLEERGARMTIGYIPGWVDDGDPTRGHLLVAGENVERVPGRVHPSPLVRYVDAAGTHHDYGEDFAGVQELRARGLAEVELHGFTHMHPDTSAWAAAGDRYERQEWYRELGRSASSMLETLPPDRHPLALGIDALTEAFGTRPAALIPPGDDFTDAAVKVALDLGLQLVSSYYLAVRLGGRFCWATHVCAPYLDRPDPAWFDCGLPVVATFHDFDVARHGVDWLAEHLDRWRAAGACGVIDLRSVAEALR